MWKVQFRLYYNFRINFFSTIILERDGGAKLVPDWQMNPVLQCQGVALTGAVDLTLDVKHRLTNHNRAKQTIKIPKEGSNLEVHARDVNLV